MKRLKKCRLSKNSKLMQMEQLGPKVKTASVSMLLRSLHLQLHVVISQVIPTKLTRIPTRWLQICAANKAFIYLLSVMVMVLMDIRHQVI